VDGDRGLRGRGDEPAAGGDEYGGQAAAQDTPPRQCRAHGLEDLPTSAPGQARPAAGTMVCVRERTWGANWYQPRMAWNSGVAVAAGLSSSYTVV